VLAFEGVSPFHLSVNCLVLGEGLEPDKRFELVVHSLDPAPERTSAGFAWAHVLAGGSATAQSENAPLFAQLFADIRGEPDVLYVQEGAYLPRQASLPVWMPVCI